MKPMKLHKRRKRIGRGQGSGHGKTSCRGHKGQRSRSGGRVRPGFEGGQMPITRRIPKRGFRPLAKKKYNVVNVQTLNKLTKESIVTPERLVELDIIKNTRNNLKILGDGEISRAVTVKAHAFSQSAVAKIEKAGGKTEVINDVRGTRESRGGRPS